MFKIFSIFYENWKKITLRIAVFQSKVLLTIFYLTFLAPFGIILSYINDMLEIRNKKITNWKPKEQQADTLEKLRKQF